MKLSELKAQIDKFQVPNNSILKAYDSNELKPINSYSSPDDNRDFVILSTQSITNKPLTLKKLFSLSENLGDNTFVKLATKGDKVSISDISNLILQGTNVILNPIDDDLIEPVVEEDKMIVYRFDEHNKDSVFITSVLHKLLPEYTWAVKDGHLLFAGETNDIDVEYCSHSHVVTIDPDVIMPLSTVYRIIGVLLQYGIQFNCPDLNNTHKLKDCVKPDVTDLFELIGLIKAETIIFENNLESFYIEEADYFCDYNSNEGFKISYDSTPGNFNDGFLIVGFCFLNRFYIQDVDEDNDED